MASLLAAHGAYMLARHPVAGSVTLRVAVRRGFTNLGEQDMTTTPKFAHVVLMTNGADTVTDAQGRSCAAPHPVQPLEQSPHGRGMDGEARADA